MYKMLISKPHFKNLVYRIIYKILKTHHLRKMTRCREEPVQYLQLRCKVVLLNPLLEIT